MSSLVGGMRTTLRLSVDGLTSKFARPSPRRCSMLGDLFGSVSVGTGVMSDSSHRREWELGIWVNGEVVVSSAIAS